MSYATYSIILYCRGWLSCHINRNTCRIGYRLSISWVFWYQTNPSYQCLCTLQRICHCWYYLRGADRLDGQSSSQPHEPGYGSVYKELGANESIGLERNHWFWMVAGCGRVWDGSDDGWPSSSCSTNISCSFGVLSGSLGAKIVLASGKMISFLLGIPNSFMISCFLQRIQHNQVTRGLRIWSRRMPSHALWIM
jgi:hypothetical protein